MNKRYLFLLAWASGSEGEEDANEKTKVHKQEDLLKQFKQGNDAIFAVEIWAPGYDVAAAVGYREAFQENYTGYDTLSVLESLTDEKLAGWRDNVPSFTVEENGTITEHK